MNDTMITLVGNAATAVEHRQTPTGVPVARFRLAATPRRWDRARERWTDGDTSFFTVKAWRALADHVAASVTVGEPLLVQGRLRVREGEQSADRGGQRWIAAEVEAVAIGHDLARGTTAFRRTTPRPRTETQPGERAGGGSELVPDWSTGGGAAWREAAPVPPAPDAGGGGGAAEAAARAADGAAAGEGEKERAKERARERESEGGMEGLVVKA
ncbi:single-stranded DNA-binding protein [Streptomyces sp. NPDC002067]